MKMNCSRGPVPARRWAITCANFGRRRCARRRSNRTARRRAFGSSARITSRSAPPTAASVSSMRSVRIAASRWRLPGTRATDCAACFTAGRSMSPASWSTRPRNRRSGKRHSAPTSRSIIIRFTRRADWSGSISASARRRRRCSISNWRACPKAMSISAARCCAAIGYRASKARSTPCMPVFCMLAGSAIQHGAGRVRRARNCTC